MPFFAWRFVWGRLCHLGGPSQTSAVQRDHSWAPPYVSPLEKKSESQRIPKPFFRRKPRILNENPITNHRWPTRKTSTILQGYPQKTTQKHSRHVPRTTSGLSLHVLLWRPQGGSEVITCPAIQRMENCHVFFINM